jgi:hypothetical protein
LVVVVGWQNTVIASNTAVSYGGQAMTAIDTTEANGGIGVRGWTLDEAGIAAAANTTIAVTMSDTTDHLAIAAIAFSGVASVGSATSSNGTGTTITATPSPAGTASDMQFGAVIASADLTISAGSGQYTATLGQRHRGSTAAGNGTIVWTIDGGENWAFQSLLLVASVAAPTEAMEWKQPTSQPSNHYRPDIIIG